MYRGFQLQPGTLQLLSYKPGGQKIYDGFKTQVKPMLDKYILTNGSLDGSKMQEDWFPNVNAGIFISHSHDDRDLAIGLAGWLYEKFKIVAFIDSCIWGYSGDLLERLSPYCKDGMDKNYDFEKTIRAAAHVHMMLNNALSKMIDRTECLFFLKTPLSTVRNIIQTKTNSPWIYSEISQSQIVRKLIPPRFTTTKLLEGFSAERAFSAVQKKALKVEYFLELNHLMPLSGGDLTAWNNNWNSPYTPRLGNPLDRLYLIKPIKKSH